MYFFGWIALVVISLWISVLAFIWAVRSGQFSDQARARYMPLRDGLPPEPEMAPTARTKEAYALGFIGLLSLIAMVAMMVVSQWTRGH